MKKKDKIKKNKNKNFEMRTRQNDATARTTSNSGKHVLLNDDNYVPTKKIKTKSQHNNDNVDGNIPKNINHEITGRLNKKEANIERKKKFQKMMTIVKRLKVKKV